MNLQTFTHAKRFTKRSVARAISLAALLLAFATPVSADWKLDLSRRQKSVRSEDLKQAAEVTTETQKPSGLFEAIFDSKEPMQELVIINTEKGFLPANVRVRKGARYLVHVVNVNEKEKNVSFVLDAFSEHHATYFGKVKSFRIEPKKEGVFSFQCPETSAEGRIVVYAPVTAPPPASIRSPASRSP